jgi:hypothetical protein
LGATPFDIERALARVKAGWIDDYAAVVVAYHELTPAPKGSSAGNSESKLLIGLGPAGDAVFVLRVLT